MNVTNEEILKKQQERRKRINRMKNIIVTTIATWMILSFLAIVILSVCVIRLNYKVNKLEQRQAVEPPKVTGEASDNDTEDMETEAAFAYKTGIDESENMATEGDIHKVYLTFNSIPGENTLAILDALADSNVKATFFVSEVDSEEARDICKRIVDEGHTLAMNSYSNEYSTIYNSVDDFSEDYHKIAEFIKEITGEKCLFYRFPGGSGNTVSNVGMEEFVKVLNKEQITYFDWNVSAGDVSLDYSTKDIVKNVKSGVSNYKTSVVLLHDDLTKSTTADAITPLIKALKGMDAEVLPIDENTYVVQYIKADSVGQ